MIRSERDKLVADFLTKQGVNAGESTCPVCKRHWTVTPIDDCHVPDCGCFGTDTTAANPERPCEECGIKHSMVCEHMPGRDR